MAKPAGGNPSIPLAQIQTPEGMETTVITYDYDPLYRLTEAVYTEAITATYNYVYDAVGNMTAYTETIDAETTSVSRTFDAANRLEEAQINGIPRYYGYDNNGNMTFANATGGIAEYYYNQRNMLTSQRLVGFEESTLIAEFVYDGTGNRLQQVDYTGSQPITTTYTNDIVGLSQVLVASDGTTTTHNLFGLDLIHQDDGTTTRTLLADGLGSVRTEMVAGAIETVTTYEPYGNLLAQTGTSGTTYGFTGEQRDAATGLLYLRARYYNPGLRIFNKRDPWKGNMRSPGTLHGFVYVFNNPVRYNDPNGLQCNDTSSASCTAVTGGSKDGYWDILKYAKRGEGVSVYYEEVIEAFSCSGHIGPFEANGSQEYVHGTRWWWYPQPGSEDYSETNSQASVGGNIGIVGLSGYGESSNDSSGKQKNNWGVQASGIAGLISVSVENDGDTEYSTEFSVSSNIDPTEIPGVPVACAVPSSSSVNVGVTWDDGSLMYVVVPTHINDQFSNKNALSSRYFRQLFIAGYFFRGSYRTNIYAPDSIHWHINRNMSWGTRTGSAPSNIFYPFNEWDDNVFAWYESPPPPNACPIEW